MRYMGGSWVGLRAALELGVVEAVRVRRHLGGEKEVRAARAVWGVIAVRGASDVGGVRRGRGKTGRRATELWMEIDVGKVCGGRGVGPG